jgi:hypothetical protein
MMHWIDTYGGLIFPVACVVFGVLAIREQRAVRRTWSEADKKKRT